MMVSVWQGASWWLGSCDPTASHRTCAVRDGSQSYGVLQERGVLYWAGKGGPFRDEKFSCKAPKVSSAARSCCSPVGSTCFVG